MLTVALFGAALRARLGVCQLQAVPSFWAHLTPSIPLQLVPEIPSESPGVGQRDNVFSIR